MFSFEIVECDRKEGPLPNGISFAILSDKKTEDDAVLDMLRVIFPFYKANPKKIFRISMCETAQTKSVPGMPPVVMSYTDWKNISKIFYLGNFLLGDIIARHKIADVEIEERKCSYLADGTLVDSLSGYCKSTEENDLISLDGDFYSYDSSYFMYQVEFSLSGSGVAHELTVWQDGTACVRC